MYYTTISVGLLNAGINLVGMVFLSTINPHGVQMKTKLFLKHFGNNVMQICILFLVMAICGVAAYYIFGVDPIFGLIAFMFAMLGYFVVQRSLEQATRDINNDF
jgi:hypothetical protein